eukprot:jgi/Orpsp1_1/1192616/evm.model.d7180000094637.1
MILLIFNYAKKNNINLKFNKKNNIIMDLINKEKLNLENLTLILNIKKDATLITSEVLCKLIELDEYKLINFIFQYKYYDINFIKKILSIYNKKKTKLHIEELNYITNFIKNSNNGIININEKNKNGNFPFLFAITKNNIEMVKLIIDYANKNNIILEINEKDKNRNYPFLEAIKNNNIEMVQTIINYANEKSIILEINDKNMYGNYPFLTA